MLSKSYALAATAALAISGGAFAQASAPAAKLSHQDSSFIKDAAEGGNAEIEGSKMALQQSANPDVKTFAQTMVDDHTKAAGELATLAGQKGVKISDKPSLLKQGELKLLSKRTDSFDKHYADSIGVKAHEDTVKLFQKEVDKGTDADVKAWASSTLPTLQHHLEMAQALKAKTDAADKK